MPPGLIDAGIFLPDAEGTDAEGNPDMAAPPPAKNYVRLAQMSPDVGAVDFCVKTKIDQFGPFVTPSPMDGTAAGVAFGEVSHYFAVPASGTVDIVAVAAPAMDCSSPRAVGTFTIDAAKHETIVLMGVAKGSVSPDQALGLAAFVDDANGDPTLVRLRVVNAALGTAQSLGVGAIAAALTVGNTIAPLAAEVLPRKASTPSSVDPTVDALGYHSLTTAPKGFVGLRVSYGGDGGVNVWTSKPVDLGLTLGSSRTAYVVSVPSFYKNQGLGAFVCDDVDHAPTSPCVWAAAY